MMQRLTVLTDETLSICVTGRW